MPRTNVTNTGKTHTRSEEDRRWLIDSGSAERPS
jgi:hypothetical protein